jgi:O-acetylhomoserine (thiol)-lyase
MAGYSDPGFDTLALHAGAAPDPSTGARAVPIHLTTSFVFESSDQAAALFNLERPGHVYSRISNPTNAVLEQRISALEGGIGAITTASGQAALHLAIATLMGAGSHIVASAALYGGSHNLLHYTLSRFGISTTFVKPGDLDGWKAAVQPNTKLFFGETVGNPGMDVLDIEAVSAIAHEAGVPLLVDSTTGPIWFTTRPPSFWRVTAQWWAAWWSMAAALTGTNRASSPSSARPTKAFTTWCSAKKAPWVLSCCAPGAKVCATSGLA